MAKTYILIDGSGRATHIAERDIQRVASEYLASGDAFQIFKAEPMRLQLTLTPATGRAPAFAGGGGPSRKKKRRKKAAKKGKRSKRAAQGTGRVGRPPVNVGPCVVPSCNNPSKTKGLCSAHYQKHRRLQREGGAGLVDAAGKPTAAAASEGPAATRKRRTRRKKAGAGKTAARRKRTGRKKTARKKKGGRKKAAKKATASAS